MTKKTVISRIKRFKYNSYHDFYRDIKRIMPLSEEDTIEIGTLINELGQDKPRAEWVIPEGMKKKNSKAAGKKKRG